MSREAAGAEQVRALIGKAPEMKTRDTWPAPDMRLVNDDRRRRRRSTTTHCQRAGGHGSLLKLRRARVRATTLQPD